MLTLFVALFVVGGVASTLAQKSFFDTLAAAEPDVLDDAELADRVLKQPLALSGLVAAQTKTRLRSLLRHHPIAPIERRRRIALASITGSVIGFVGIGLTLTGLAS